MKEFAGDKQGAGKKDTGDTAGRAKDDSRGGQGFGGYGAGEGQVAPPNPMAAMRFGHMGAIRMAQSGGVDVTKHVGKGAKGGGAEGASGEKEVLGSLGEVNSGISQKLAKSTGVDVSDAKVVSDPKLEELGKRGVARDGKEIGVATPELVGDDQLMAHEGIHIVQQRGGSKSEADGSLAEDEGRRAEDVQPETQAISGTASVLEQRPTSCDASAGEAFEVTQPDEPLEATDAMATPIDVHERNTMTGTPVESDYQIADPTFIKLFEQAGAVDGASRTLSLDKGAVKLIDLLGAQDHKDFEKLLYGYFRPVWRDAAEQSDNTADLAFPERKTDLDDEDDPKLAMPIGDRYSVLDPNSGEAIGLLASTTICKTEDGEFDLESSNGSITSVCHGPSIQVMVYYSVNVDLEKKKVSKRLSMKLRGAAAVLKQSNGTEKRAVATSVSELANALGL